MDVLSRTELHAAVAAEGRRHLVDLVPKDRLQDWAASCRLSREQFAGKVAELEGLFLALQANVEGLLMKAPRTDLDEMGRQMEQVSPSRPFSRLLACWLVRIGSCSHRIRR